MPNDPTLSLRPCTPADIPELAALNLACFTGPRIQVQYKDVTPSDKLAILEEAFHRAFSSPKDSAHPQFVHPLCVVDTSTNEIIAEAIWIYLPKGYVGSEDADAHHPLLRPGINEQLQRDFDDETRKLRSAHPGRKEAHWLLSLLATHPKHEGRGAGSMLINWALPKADEMGVRCYVDASAIGYPVYKKRGFGEEVGVLELDLSKYEGGEGFPVQRYVALMREPRKVGYEEK